VCTCWFRRDPTFPTLWLPLVFSRFALDRVWCHGLPLTLTAVWCDGLPLTLTAVWCDGLASQAELLGVPESIPILGNIYDGAGTIRGKRNGVRATLEVLTGLEMLQGASQQQKEM
jgi:hypothetical protein